MRNAKFFQLCILRDLSAQIDFSKILLFSFCWLDTVHQLVYNEINDICTTVLACISHAWVTPVMNWMFDLFYRFQFKFKIHHIQVCINFYFFYFFSLQRTIWYFQRIIIITVWSLILSFTQGIQFVTPITRIFKMFLT